MEERLIRVEEKVAAVATDMTDIKTSMKDIATSMRTLAVLEEKHSSVQEALKRAFGVIQKTTERLEVIEKAMPNLILASSWVFKAVIAVMAILGVAAIGTLIKGATG